MLDEEIIKYIEEGKGFVAILAGSGSDDKEKGNKKSHIEQIIKSLEAYEIPYGVNICSAHKQAEELENVIKEYNGLNYPILLIAVAGGTDALSGTASWESYHPVLSCPPDAPNSSSLKNPPGSSNAYIEKAKNVGKFAAQMFSHLDRDYLRQKISDINQQKIISLEADDKEISKKYLNRLNKIKE